MKLAMRSAYVRMIRLLRCGLAKLGILGWLERRGGRVALWLRSLFAIYDIDDLVHLDMPWWTFDAVDEVDRFLLGRPNARVFEWGSGASTVWLSKRAGEVFSVEHDPEWAKVVAPRVENLLQVQTMTVPSQEEGLIASNKFGFEGQFFDEYVEAIDKVEGEFDLIVIDGRAREACFEKALPRLAPGGRILFDDFKRQRYRNAVLGRGFEVQNLDGLAVCLPLPDSTALLFQES